MTRKLEELFGLDNDEQNSVSETVTEPIILPENIEQTHQAALSNLEKIEQALSEVKDLDKTDAELDELAKNAKEAFNNLLDLGMQVDSRFSAEIFNSASSMLGHAVTATTAKINKKLKTVQLQLQKAELDRKTAAALASAANNSKTPTETPLGQAQVLDRNELLKILAQSKISSEDK